MLERLALSRMKLLLKQQTMSLLSMNYDRSLEILERVFGDEHPDVATIRKNLASLRTRFNDQGSWIVLERPFRQQSKSPAAVARQISCKT